MVQHGHFHARVPSQYLGQLVTEGVVSYNDKSRESCAITVDWRNWVRPFSTKISYDPRIVVANASFSPMRTKNKLKLHWTMLVWKTIIYCSKLFFFAAVWFRSRPTRVFNVRSHFKLHQIRSWGTFLLLVWPGLQTHHSGTEFTTHVHLTSWNYTTQMASLANYSLDLGCNQNISKSVYSFQRRILFAWKKASRFHDQAPEIRGNC